MMTPPKHDRTKVSEVPSQHIRPPHGGHRHHDEIWNVRTAVRIAFRKLQCKRELARGRSFQSVDPGRKAFGERDRSPRVPSGAEQEIDLDENGPWNDDVASQSGQQLGGKEVPAALSTVHCRNERAGVADDQCPRRARICSTFWERSSSSSMRPV